MEDVKPQVPGVKAEPIDVDLQPLSSEREDEAKYEPMTEEEIKAAVDRLQNICEDSTLCIDLIFMMFRTTASRENQERFTI
ncbi:hypothetical protein SCP_0202610 [Sparassis crispa]|uniref:Uncharacterized protein n=1 Tax=Sparassis crispa TaxID=139825 RepID=A0A401GA61_9APHY|nr:hypothetical protein SCP_0202610 [Sparassis crispa]GBE79064.1 hypothetical protein SCP_0202610 [Sparassis crispa]